MSFLAKEWSYKKEQSLPNSSFAYVDAEGGHFPIKDEHGKLDKAHIKNAFSRLPQSKFSPEIKKKIHGKLVRAAKQVGLELSSAAYLAAKAPVQLRRACWRMQLSFLRFKLKHVEEQQA
jgi:hypothetical protein